MHIIVNGCMRVRVYRRCLYECVTCECKLVSAFECECMSARECECECECERVSVSVSASVRLSVSVSASVSACCACMCGIQTLADCPYQGVRLDDTIAVLTGDTLLHHLQHLRENKRPQARRKRHFATDLDEIVRAIDGHRQELNHGGDVVKQAFRF